MVKRVLRHLQLEKVRQAGLHHRKVHLNKVVLDAADFCRGEDSFPIEAILANRHYFVRRCRPPLNVHGYKPSWILGEVVCSIVAITDRRHLKLKLNEFWIEELKQQVVSPLAIDLSQFKVFVMQRSEERRVGT